MYVNEALARMNGLPAAPHPGLEIATRYLPAGAEDDIAVLATRICRIP
ncbi:hypothetical protein AB0E83_04305 [Streptomyces sp. NPDC035033]